MATAIRVARGPAVDGRLDDEVWKQAPAGGPLTQVVPVEGAAPSERTEFRVVYDDRDLYIGVWCYDSAPERILSREMARDGEIYRDDFVTVFLDTFHDRRNGYLFTVNPNGAQLDFLISNNTEADSNWDGVWSTAATIDAEGWKVEIEIPFIGLSFDPAISTWGFNLSRFMARRNERCRWSRPSQNVWSYNAAEAGELRGLHGLERGIGVEIVPYAASRYREDRVAGDDDLTFEGGGDLRFRITPALGGRLSYNTDFAETEVDERQVNLTRFPLFFPEKRDFFLEDGGIFNFGGLGPELLPFFSRRIGLTDEGKVVPIAVAGKLTGRAGGYNLGFVDVLLDDHDDLGMRNVAVGRVSRNVLEQSSIGLLATVGDPNSTSENVLGGADLGFRTTTLWGHDVLEARLFGLTTWTEGAGDGDPFAFGGEVDLPNDLYQAQARFYQVGDDFHPTLGFVPRRAVRVYSAGGGYSPRPGFLELVRQVHVRQASTLFTDLDGRPESAELRLTPLAVDLETGDAVFLEGRYEMDAPGEDFEISRGVVIPPGSYWWPSASVGFTTVNTRAVSLQFRYTGGGFYTGTRDGYALGTTLRPSRYVGVDLGYELNQVRLEEGSFETRLALVRLRVHPTPRLSWSNLVQYDNVSDTVGYHGRIRWEMEPGSNLYLVFDQNVDRDEGRLRRLESELTVKVEVTFRF